VTATRLLVATHNPAVADRVRGVLLVTPDIDLCGETSPAGVFAAAVAVEPHLVLLDLDPSAPLGPALVTALLGRPRLRLLVLWPANSRPMPEALTRGLGVGRLEIMRPPVPGPPDSSDRWDRALVDTIRAISKGLWATPPAGPGPVLLARPSPALPPRIIGIAASTGGPPALAKILADLPGDLPVPLLLVQHMIPGFGAGLVDWLSRVTAIRVLVAVHDTAPAPGCLYIAPADYDLELGPQRRLHLGRGKGLHCPSADVLFLSLAKVLGAEAAAVVLTGMGNDGAEGLLAIGKAGGTTIAQDEASSVVFGMPKAAIATGGVTRVLALDAIAGAIRRLAGGSAAVVPPGAPVVPSPAGRFEGEPR
jgi:two-component system, chemotaxis family, protein-glutamate methylesterase/glutaminase